MSDRKYELQCLRLAAECMQLVSDVRSATLQRHFLEMARAWTAEAENGPASLRATAAPSRLRGEVDARRDANNKFVS